MPQINFTPQDQESLSKICDRLTAVVEQLRGVATSAARDGVEPIQVIEFKNFVKGMKLVEAFADNARNAYHDAIVEKGILAAKVAPDQKKTRSK